MYGIDHRKATYMVDATRAPNQAASHLAIQPIIELLEALGAWLFGDTKEHQSRPSLPPRS
jgi:hypothetical protein